MRPTHNIETALVREKAERMDNGELLTEIARCKRGIQVASNTTARARFQRRLDIMNAEADARMKGAR